MSTQAKLVSLPTGVSVGRTLRGNRQIFENQRRFSAITRDLSPAQINQLFTQMQIFIEEGHPDTDLTTRVANLSKREHEVLVLLSNGYSRREIGEALGISLNTAARHISNIYRKLGVTTVAEATRYALALPDN